jgi:hypothetical protein
VLRRDKAARSGADDRYPGAGMQLHM